MLFVNSTDTIRGLFVNQLSQPSARSKSVLFQGLATLIVAQRWPVGSCSPAIEGEGPSWKRGLPDRSIARQAAAISTSIVATTRASAAASGPGFEAERRAKRRTAGRRG